MTGPADTTAAVVVTATAVVAAPTVGFVAGVSPGGSMLPAVTACTLAAVVAAAWLVPAGRLAPVLIAMSWLLPRFAAWQSVGPSGRALLLAATPLAIAGAALVLRGPLVRAAVVLCAAAVTLHALAYDPFLDPACRWTCLAVGAPLSTVVGPRAGLLGCLGLAAAASCVALVPARGRPWTLHGAGSPPAAVALALLTTAALAASAAGRPDGAQWLATVGVLLGAGGIATDGLRLRWVRGRVRRAVARLAEPVGGPAAEVHFAAPDSDAGSATPGGDAGSATLRGDAGSGAFSGDAGSRVPVWLDGDGLAAADDGRAYAVLHDAGVPAVRLMLPARADAAATLAALTPADRLALQNARLRAAVGYRQRELRASQRRIVETADAERRRIERDLHDGAQQRLVAVAMQLRSAGSRHLGEPGGAAILAAEHGVLHALAALRAHSSAAFDDVLAAEGLAAAVEDVVAAFPAVRLEVRLDHPGPSRAVQRVALAAVAGLVDEHSRCVSIVDEDGWLTITVAGRHAGSGPAGLAELTDRVGALDGEVRRCGRDGTVQVRLPCG